MGRRGQRDGAGTGDEVRAARLERSVPSGNPNLASWRPAAWHSSLSLDSQTSQPHLAPSQMPDARQRSAALRVPTSCERRLQAAFPSIACMRLASSDASRDG